MSKQHIAYFDFLRGVAIMMVVGIHTFPKCSWDDSSDWGLIVIRQFLNCAVPIFLALSAFFLAKKSFDSSDKLYSFWRKQIPKVYIPCLIWSLPLFLLAIKNGANPMLETVRLFICGYSIYYFVALIIQCYIILPILTSIDKSGGVISALVSMTCISLYLYTGMKLPLIFYAGPCLVWIMFFCQGILMGKTKRDYTISILLLLLVLSLILQLIESYYLYAIRGDGFGIKASAFLYSFIVILILFAKKSQAFYESNNNKFLSFIEYIGKISFGIYLIHMYVIRLVNKFIGFENWGIKWFLALVLSMAIIYGVKQILPDKFASKYLGFL